MNEVYTIMAHGIQLGKGLAEFVQRAASLFEGLAAIDPLLTHWCKFPGEAAQVMTSEIILQVQTEQTGSFGDSSNHSDDGRFFMSTGSAYDWYSINIHIVRGTLSHIALIISPKGKAITLLTTQTITKIMKCMIDTMQPEWVIARTELLFYMKSQRKGRHPEIGWITYLTTSLQSLPALPPPSYVEPYANGVLITATNDLFVRQNPEHMAIINAIDDVLVGAGIFDPGTFTDMDAVARIPGVQLITLTNPSSREILFVIEPNGQVFPMSPGAEFKVVTYNGEELHIEEEQYATDEGSITVHTEFQPIEVYYNGVLLFSDVS